MYVVLVASRFELVGEKNKCVMCNVSKDVPLKLAFRLHINMPQASLKQLNKIYLLHIVSRKMMYNLPNFGQNAVKIAYITLLIRTLCTIYMLYLSVDFNNLIVFQIKNFFLKTSQMDLSIAYSNIVH